MGKSVGIVVLLVALSVAFYTTTIVPDGFTQPWKLRTILTFIRLGAMAVELSPYFGFEEVYVLRNIITMWKSHEHQLNDTYVNLLDTTIEDVDVRLFWPVNRKSTSKMRGIVFLHGGGWSIGNVEAYSPQTYELSRQLDAFVVAVELAPEHPFPVPFEDCVKVTRYFLKHANKYGVDPQRIAVAGDSAGGNLAAAVSLRLRDEKVQPKLKLQVLIYPSLQATDFNTPSAQHNKYGPFLTQRNMIYYKNLYMFGHIKNVPLTTVNNHTPSEYKKTLGKEIMDIGYLPDDDIKASYVPLNDETGDFTFWNKHKSLFLNPYFSPLHAETLKHLPKTYIKTCQYDILRDDGYFYAARLQKFGVKVTHVNMHVCFHGWLNFLHDLETSEMNFAEIVLFISNNL